jgi:hypothetical protein
LDRFTILDAAEPCLARIWREAERVLLDDAIRPADPCPLLRGGDADPIQSFREIGFTLFIAQLLDTLIARTLLIRMPVALFGRGSVASESTPLAPTTEANPTQTQPLAGPVQVVDLEVGDGRLGNIGLAENFLDRLPQPGAEVALLIVLRVPDLDHLEPPATCRGDVDVPALRLGHGALAETLIDSVIELDPTLDVVDGADHRFLP